jgi:hypothetical protein
VAQVGDEVSRSAAAVRPDVLAYPSPTTSRYLIFATALLSAGLFVGGWVHNQTVGQKWADTYLGCQATYGVPVPGFDEESFAAQDAILDCVGDVERVRAWMTLGGAGLSALLALGILVVAPVVVRRRRGLRDLDSRLQGAHDRFGDLARASGVRTRVRPMVGRTGQRDAFTFGRPGDHVVALPPAVAVRWRDPSLFDPVVSHELAHVRHRDVALAWLTRSVWFALAPLLLLPVVVGLAAGDFSLLPGYSWRAAMLALVVALVSASLLRSREHDADLRAARLCGGPASMARVLGSTAGRRPGPQWVGLLANHPTPAERGLVLDEPGRVARTRFVDGLTAGFLAGLSLPLLVAAAYPLAAQLGDSNASYVAGAAVVGPLLAGSIGLATWREALVDRLVGHSRTPYALAGGVGAGLMLGKAGSLQQSVAGLTGLQHPVWLLAIGAAGAGATLLSSALGEVWADLSPRLPSARAAWLVALVVNAALFTGLLWASELFVFSADTGGWGLARQGLVWTLSTWPLAVLVLGIAAFTTVALVLGRRRIDAAPSWLVEGEAAAGWPEAARLAPATPVLAGVAAGLVGVGAVVAFRLLEGTGSTDEEIIARILTSEWLAGAVAAGCVLAVAVLRHGWGSAAGMVSGAVAAVVVTVGVVVDNVVAGGSFHADQVWSFLVPSWCLGLFLGTALLPAAALLSSMAERHTSGGFVVGVVCAAALTASLTVLPARTLLVGAHPLDAPVEGAAETPTDLTRAAARRVLTNYLQDVAPGIAKRSDQANTTLTKILGDQDLDAAVQADRLHTEVLPPMRELLGDIEDFESGLEALDEAHQEVVEAVRTGMEKVRVIVDYLRHGDQSLVDRATQLRDEENGHWTAWYDKLDQLTDQYAG